MNSNTQDAWNDDLGDLSDLTDRKGDSTPITPLKESDQPPKETKDDANVVKEVKNSSTFLNSNTKTSRLYNVLEAPNVDITQLRKLAWSGIPETLRPITWSILLGHMPANLERREAALKRKRQEYEDMIVQSFGRGEDGLDATTIHQIRIDVLRTGADTLLFQQDVVQRALERILYCWALRHPASGYVQGINDLATPFLYVFLSQHVGSYGLSIF